MTCFSCSKKTINPEDNADAMQNYKKGLAYWQNEQVEEAEYHFRKAVDKDSNFVPAYEGLARVALAQHQTVNAWQLIQKSLDLQPDWISSILIKAQIQYERKLYVEAINSSKTILRIYTDDESVLKNPADLENTFALLAKCYSEDAKYKEALAALNLAIRENPESSEYREMKAYLQQVEAALYGKSETVKQIAVKNTISRGELCLLINVWFEDDLRRINHSQNLPADVLSDYVYFYDIKIIIETGIIPIFPDGAFKPGFIVRRAELALFLQKLCHTVSSKFFPEIKNEKFYADVLPDQYYFNAVQFLAAHDIMITERDVRFLPDHDVTGMEAVIAIDQLRLLLSDTIEY